MVVSVAVVWLGVPAAKQLGERSVRLARHRFALTETWRTRYQGSMSFKCRTINHDREALKCDDPPWRHLRRRESSAHVPA